jgi:sn-glycerol 3-phosphate transport system substrate-binding protein
MRRERKTTALRSIAAIAIAAISTVGLVACGPSEPAAEDGPVKLQLLFPIAVGGPLTEVMDKLVDRYEDTHENVEVEAVYSGTYGDTMTKARAQFKANQPPDLLIASSVELFNLRDADMIEAIDDVLAGTDLSWIDDFYPALMANSQFDGKTWGIPFQRSTIVQYYNKEAFAAAGLDPEKPPATWEELKSDALAISKAGAATYGLQIPSDAFGDWLFAALAWQNGISMVSDDGTKAYLNDPKTVAALQYWVDLGKAGAVPEGNVAWATTPKDFIEGKTAMMWTTTGNLTNVKNQATFDFGVSPLPAHVQAGSPTGGANLYVFKTGDDHKEKAAAEFIKWMSAPEQSAEWSIATGYIATTPAAYETQAMKDYVASFPPALVARDQLTDFTRALGWHGNSQVNVAVADAVQAALGGTKSPQQALDDAQKTADSVLAPFQ